MSEKKQPEVKVVYTADTLRNAIGELVKANDGKMVYVGAKHFAKRDGEKYYFATIEAKQRDTSASEIKTTTDLNLVFRRLNLSAKQKGDALESVMTTKSFIIDGKKYEPQADGSWVLPKTRVKPNAKKPMGRTFKEIGYGACLLKIANVISAYAKEKQTLDGFQFRVQ